MGKVDGESETTPGKSTVATNFGIVTKLTDADISTGARPVDGRTSRGKIQGTSP